MAERPYAGVVLAGGRSSRLGQDKTRVDMGGCTVLDRVLAAVADAAQVVVVGAPRPLAGDLEVEWVQEEPPGGGPAAGVAAAVPLVRQPWVVVLAGDLPLVEADTVGRLLTAATGYDGAVLLDADGRRQHLSVALQTSALRALTPTAGRGEWHNAPMWSLLDRMHLAEMPATGHETLDVDDAQDVETARRLTEEREER